MESEFNKQFKKQARRQLSRIKASLVIVPLVMMAFSFGKWRGKWQEWMAPELKREVLSKSTLSFEAQKKLFLDFDYRVCKAIIPCGEVSMTGNPEQIQKTCQIGLNELNAPVIPASLPSAIKKNMQLYLQSSINGNKLMIDAWQIQGDKVKGASLISTMKNWEIDTCTYKSIPQKMRRLYQLNGSDSHTLITCKEIEQMYSANVE